MKDTIRLKQSNKAALEATGYNDANEALAAVFKERDSLKDQLKVKLTLQSAAKELQNATCVDETPPWRPDAAFWAQFRDEVSSVIRPPTKAAFFTASTPIKTIGKIDPEERLQEPIGKQGRDLR
jgi:hypothetical protein